MDLRSKVLPVPYYTQPKGNFCQSTVLLMYAEYLERYMVFQSTGAGERSISDIYNDINTSQGQSPDPRPIKGVDNNHDNMMWWLEKSFPRLKFHKFQTTNPAQALLWIIRSINRGFPVMASVSHQNVGGHIILIVGYRNYRPDASFANDIMSFEPAVRLVVHDPYGAFDPALNSNLWGANWRSGGMSLYDGGEKGPGRSVLLPLSNVNRRVYKKTNDRTGNYELMTVL